MATIEGRPVAFDEAFNRLSSTVSRSDAIAFNSTTLEDVWNCAREIELAQRRKRSLRNLRRIEPLLKGLEIYAKSIDVICNGTPFVPWIWVRSRLFPHVMHGSPYLILSRRQSSLCYR
jgi:hypothetical protein